MNKHKQNLICVSLLFCLMISSGCSIVKAYKEFALIKKASFFEGQLKNVPHEKPVFILIYREADKKLELASISLKMEPDAYRFMKLPGCYRIVAFEDSNEDFIYQTNEWATCLDPIEAETGVRYKHLELTLQPPDEIQLDMDIKLSLEDLTKQTDFPKASMHEIVDIDDPRFTRENGSLGLWQPIKFLETVGGGLYFMEPYDPEKIPLIFVHGAGGNPSEWSYLIKRLDRERYQPWLVYYPSGLRLDLISKVYAEAFLAYYLQYRFEQFGIIAHSMGGVVSQGIINRFSENGLHNKLNCFLTISTPWQGHSAAELGVKRSPVVVPSWVDISPGSDYLEQLQERPFSGNTHYYLFFSYQGSSRFTEGNDDGSVSISSQLDMHMQNRAEKMYGFNEGHVSILESELVFEHLCECLDKSFNKQIAVERIVISTMEGQHEAE